MCSENREAMDAAVEVLLEKESITGDEFRAILSKYAQIPQENLDAVERQKQPDPELSLA
jgi:cell division protease FtsH